MQSCVLSLPACSLTGPTDINMIDATSDCQTRECAEVKDENLEEEGEETEESNLYRVIIER